MADDPDQQRIRLQISDEIQSIMDRYDVGGIVFLVSMDSASWRVVTPKWSGLQPSPEHGGAMRLRLNSKMPNAQRVADSTLHLIASLRDMTRDATEIFGQIFRQAKRALEAQGAVVEHTRNRAMNPSGGESE